MPSTRSGFKEDHPDSDDEVLIDDDQQEHNDELENLDLSTIDHAEVARHIAKMPSLNWPKSK